MSVKKYIVQHRAFCPSPGVNYNIKQPNFDVTTPETATNQGNLALDQSKDLCQLAQTPQIFLCHP
uniref:Uncharacterized protein n=1 Tax=Romanomermis culicivorax TaxID=13658 RepID=A0A915K9R2_ROMCU